MVPRIGLDGSGSAKTKMLLAWLGCSSGASLFSPELTSEWPVLIAMYCLPPTAPPGSRARLAWKNSNMAAGVATRFSRFHSYRAALA